VQQEIKEVIAQESPIKDEEYQTALEQYKEALEQYEKEKAEYQQNPKWAVRETRYGPPQIAAEFESKQAAEEWKSREDPYSQISNDISKLPFRKSKPAQPKKYDYIKPEVMAELKKKESQAIYEKRVKPYIDHADYETEYYPGGEIKKITQKPKTYRSKDEWREGSGYKHQESTYIPHEITFFETGTIKSITKRKDYSDVVRDYEKRYEEQRGVLDTSVTTFTPGGLLKSKTVQEPYERKIIEKDKGTFTDIDPFVSERWDYEKGTKVEYPDPLTKQRDVRAKPIYDTGYSPPQQAPSAAAYGGPTHDATASQIAKAKKEGTDFYKGGVRYSVVTKGEIAAEKEKRVSETFQKLGYETAIKEKAVKTKAGVIGTLSTLYATKPGEQIIISPTEQILKVKGRVTPVEFRPEFIPQVGTGVMKEKDLKKELPFITKLEGEPDVSRIDSRDVRISDGRVVALQDIGLGYKEGEKPSKLEKLKRDIFFRFEEKITGFRELGEIARQQEEFGKDVSKTRELKTQAAISYIGLIAAREFVTPFIRPVETAKGFVQLIIHPIKSGKEIISEFKTKPVGATAGMFGFVKGVRVITKGVPSITGKATAVLSPKYKPKTKTPYGEQLIKEIPKTRGKFDLGLIPAGKKPKLPVEPLKAAEQAAIPFKKEIILKLPKTTKVQSKIIDIARKEGAAVTGSYAQKVLVKGSRRFKDIDIVTESPKRLSTLIKKELGKKVTVKKVEITTPQGKFSIYRIVDETGKVIADIDPLKYAEEGFIKKFPIYEVEGLRLVSPQARLAAKVSQLGRGKRKGGKVARDITSLTSGEFIESAATRGAYGYSMAEQAASIGKKGIVTTSARDLLGFIRKRKIEIAGEGALGKPIKWKVKKGDVGHILLIPKWKTGKYVKLYHGTTKSSYEKIIKQGLTIGRKSKFKKGFKEPYISTTLDKWIGEAYAGEKGKVIELRIPKEKFKRLWEKNVAFQDPYSVGERNIAFDINIKSKYIIKAEKKGLGLFATPPPLPTSGRVTAQTRITRLGVKEKEATLLDILSGDVTLKRGKPQIVFFEDVKIGKEFKPYGLPSTELEVTLPPGSVIKRGKTRAVTLIEGRRVPIIQAEILTKEQLARLTKKLPKYKDEIPKAIKGQLKEAKLAKLEKQIRKATKEDIQFTRKITQKPLLRPSRIAGTLAAAQTKRLRETKRPPSRNIFIRKTRGIVQGEGSRFVSPTREIRKASVPRRAVPVSREPIRRGPPRRTAPRRTAETTTDITSTSEPIRRTTPRYSPIYTIPPYYVPPRTPPPTTPPPPTRKDSKFYKDRNQELITEEAPSYDIQIRKGEKRGDKFVTVDKNLPKNKALRRLKLIVDNYIEASGRLKPNTRQPRVRDDISPPNMIKFRPPKPGSKLPKNTIVEKLRNRLDTLNEQKQLSYFRQLKERKKNLINFVAATKKQEKKRKKEQVINLLSDKRSALRKSFISKKTNTGFLSSKKTKGGKFLKNDFF